VYTLLQTNFVNKQHDPLSPQQENSAGISTVRNPLLRLHSSILFLPETRADNVPKNISFYFSSFLWDRVKKQTLQSKEINHAINQGPPPYPPTTKSRSCVYLMKMSQISPAWKSSPSFPHIVAIKSIIHLNITNFRHEKRKNCHFSPWVTVSWNWYIFELPTATLCFVLWNISS